MAMRHNPYGVATAANPKAERIAMAEDDPRQRGLFAAAWTVGYAAAVVGAGGVATLALNHLAGPSGVLGEGDAVLPVFHVMAALCRAGGAEIRPLELSHEGLAGVAWSASGRDHLLLANLTAEPIRLALALPLRGRVLDTASVTAAADPAWLDGEHCALGPTLELGAYATALAMA
jgi:hypothetical protein